MKYKYYLDGNLISEPMGWDKFVTEIKRDKEMKSIMVTRDLSLTFGAHEYDYFTTKIDSVGYCAESEILIYRTSDETNWDLFHKGNIYLTDISFDEKRKECTAKIQDDSFYSYINNNFSVGGYIYSDKSKNGVTIIPPTPEYVKFTELSTGNFIPANTAGFEYKCYFVYDVFNYLIDFITDGKVQFQSQTFDVGGIYHNYVITTGYVLRYSVQNGWNGAINPAGVNQSQFNSSFPQINLKDFFDEMHKRFNLIYWIENSGVNPIIRIESEQFARTINPTPLANVYIDELIHEVDNEFLYSNVAMGSGATEEQTPFTLFPQSLNLVGFKDEEFAVTGQCNLDNTLQLKSNYIHDTNVIQDCTEQGWASVFTNEYDNELFVINVEFVTQVIGGVTFTWWQAVVSNWLSNTTPIYYNEQLNNFNIIQRFFNGIPTALAQYTGFGDNRFRAYQFPMGAYPPLVTNEPIIFSDVTAPNGFDPNTNYDVVNNRYVSPLEGIYTFRVQIGRIFTAPSPSPSSAINWAITIYDSLNVLQASVTNSVSFTSGGVYADVSIPFDPVYMGVGWYAQVAMYWNNLSGDAPDDSSYIYFECISAGNSGEINYSNPDKTPFVKYSFKIPMDYAELKLIENNIRGMIPFRRFKDLGTRYGWIKSIRYNHKDGLADVVLLASKNELYGTIPPTPFPPSLAGSELREDNGNELREDGSIELREN